MRNRPWVEKFETGEYLRKWNGYEPHILGCTIYSEHIGIGEDKFFKCVGEFNGIGDVDWWIKEELDKLSQEEVNELNLICEYKTYLKNFITHDLIVKISNFFGCETFHVYRANHKNIIGFCNQVSEFYEKILNGSKGCLDEKTIQFKEKSNPFKIVSFEEYKTQNKTKN
jgi:hypothetical protein